MRMLKHELQTMFQQICIPYQSAHARARARHRFRLDYDCDNDNECFACDNTSFRQVKNDQWGCRKIDHSSTIKVNLSRIQDIDKQPFTVYFKMMKSSEYIFGLGIMHITGKIVVAFFCLTGLATRAELQQNQVLLLYNSQNSDSLAVYNYYTSIYSGVLGFDLNDATVTQGNISYSNYETKIRDPLRTYLTNNNLEEQVVCITTTKGIPHRVQDTDNANIGDNPTGQGSETNAGDATSASVDSELSLLWQDLSNGEAGGYMDSHADNLIANPYYGDSNGLDSYSRNFITYTEWVWLNYQDIDPESSPFWYMGVDLGGGGFGVATPGNFYYTTRLDADTVQDVKDMIDRAQDIEYDPASQLIIFDESTRTYDGDDYENAAAYLVDNNVWDSDWVISDGATGTFYIGASGDVADTAKVRVYDDVAMLVSYGGNHSDSSQKNYVLTYDGQLVNGAIWNSMESYNGRPLAGLSLYNDQGSVEQWISSGGTFAFGNVWEPFAGTVAQNTVLVENWFNNDLTWVEAAWSSLPFVSWQQVVIGDPLAKANFIIPEPTSILLFLLGGTFVLHRRKFCPVC
jgi:hypothetical protein